MYDPGKPQHDKPPRRDRPEEPTNPAAAPTLDREQRDQHGDRHDILEMDVLVPRQPAVVFGLVGIEIVQNHMDLAAGMFGHQAVHEIQELDTPAALIMTGLDQARGNIEGRRTGSWFRAVCKRG